MASGSSIEIAGLIVDVPVGADAHVVCRAALVHELDAVLDVAACDLDKPYPLEDFTIDAHEPAATVPTSELTLLRERVQFLDAMSAAQEASMKVARTVIEERDSEIAGLRASLRTSRAQEEATASLLGVAYADVRARDHEIARLRTAAKLCETCEVLP
jgi:hypothetical protein